MALTNGHSPDLDGDRLKPSSHPLHSESPLSEINDLPTTTISSATDQADMSPSDDDAIHDMVTSELDEDEDAPGEEDADFDEDSVMEEVSGMRHDRSTSDESGRAPKRKSEELNDDLYMKLNPELYGLRRSGRARASLRVIESSDEDDEDGQVNSGRRRKRQKTTAATPASMKGASSALSSRASDSEPDDTYGGERGRTFAKKHRRLQAVAASGRDTPNLSEVRFSTRTAAKVTNYNENDDLGLSEEETENMTPSYWTYVDDTTPAIDQVLNHRLKGGVESNIHSDKDDFEFFIKYQGQAHYHATWKTWADAKSYRGVKRLENYWRKVVLVDLTMAHDPTVPPEDKEKWNLDREAYLDSLNDYMKIERVIGSRDGEEDTEYYVKWKGCFYEHCTWESASLASELAQNEIDRFLDRSSKLPVSNQTESRLATRSPYQPFRTQPSYIKNGQLREFQIHGVNFLAHHWCKGNNVILADEMGLGKTVQTVSFMNWLRHERGQQGPFLVVVPLSTIPSWADTFNYWTPDINYVVYSGNESSRKIIRDHELLVDGKMNKVKFNVLLTTYEYVLHESGFLSQLKWQFMAVDEAHRLKNRESHLYSKLKEFGAPSRLLITGTPMQNTLSELSALMDFLMPGKIHVEENIDLTSEHASKMIAELTDAIAPYMIRRTKQKVENDIPPKTEKIIRVELSDVQLEYYKNILTRNYAALNAGAKAQKTSLLNVMMELKKASNHPFMFPNAEDRILAGSDSREDQLKALITSSGKMMLLDQLLTKLRKDNHRVLIFSQMVKMLDILGDYLQLRGYQFQRLDGTIAAGPRRMAIDHFNASGSQDFCFLLSTRAGGLGINLMTADTVILFDSDWNPQADLQAMARAHRIGQKSPVTIYRLVSKDTVEEEVLERARNKLMLEFITIQRGVTDKDARDINDRLAKANANIAEPTSSDDISRILKRRGQKMFEQSGNQKKLEELDIDAVLENAEEHRTEQAEGLTTDGGEEFLRSFEYTDVKVDLEWDEIIPKDQLEKIKEGERKKLEEEYLESVIEQNQPRKRKAADDGEKGRAAKKRAREANYAAAAGEDGVESGAEDDSDTGQDPKRPLNEKECRHLIRAYERFGCIEEKQSEIIKEARLIGRDVDVVKATLKEIVDTAVQMLKQHEDQLEELQKATNKPVTKKDKKAVLFDFRGVKRLNAETLIERPSEMKMIRDVVANTVDWKTFRVPEASKPASYSCEWGAKEDGMLCVGIARHGYGAWVPIRDDVELGLQEKFFLEEHRVDKKEKRIKADEKQAAKSPGAVHLVRRANYLVQVLKDKTSNGANPAAKKALENHHRNNRKHMGQYHGNYSTPIDGRSPAPSGIRKGHANDGHKDARSSVDRPLHGSPNGHRRSSMLDHEKARHRVSEERKAQHHRTSSSQVNGHLLPPPKDETEARIRRILEPVSHALHKVTTATKKNYPEDDARLKVLKNCIVIIGEHVQELVRGGKYADLEDKLWEYIATHHWPGSKHAENRVTGRKLQDMHNKVLGKGKSAAAATSKETAPKAKPTQPDTNSVKTDDAAVNGTAPKVVKRSADAMGASDRKLPDFKFQKSSDDEKNSPESMAVLNRKLPDFKRPQSAQAKTEEPGDKKSPDSVGLADRKLRDFKRTTSSEVRLGSRDGKKSPDLVGSSDRKFPDFKHENIAENRPDSHDGKRSSDSIAPPDRKLPDFKRRESFGSRPESRPGSSQGSRPGSRPPSRPQSRAGSRA